MTDSSSRSVSLLALAFLGLGLASIVGGVVLIVLGVAGGAALAVAGDAGSGVATSTLALIAGVVIALGGIPELFAWYGLAKRRPWGRLLAIVFCTMSLAAFPLGTAFGAWGLWVLLSAGGVAAFGVQRSWLGDGTAIAVGWFLRPSSRRSSSWSRGRRRAREGGGAGCLLVFLLLIGFGMFVTCGEVVSSCGRAVGGGQAHGFEEHTPLSRIKRGLDENGISIGAPSPAPAPRPSLGGDVPPRDDTGVQFEIRDANGKLIGPNRIDRSDRSDRSALHGPGGTPTPTPSSPIGSSSAGGSDAPKKALYVYTDKNGTPVIVDELEKVPEDRRHTVRQP